MAHEDVYCCLRLRNFRYTHSVGVWGTKSCCTLPSNRQLTTKFTQNRPISLTKMMGTRVADIVSNWCCEGFEHRFPKNFIRASYGRRKGKRHMASSFFESTLGTEPGIVVGTNLPEVIAFTGRVGQSNCTWRYTDSSGQFPTTFALNRGDQ